MKSFNQFLQESYLSEEEARQGSLFTRSGKPQNFRKGTPFVATDPIKQGQRSPLPDAPKASPTSPGQLEIPEPKTTKVPGSQIRSTGEVRQPSLLTKSGGAQDFTKAGKGRVPFTSSEPVKATKRLSAGAPEAPKVSPGQMEIDFNARPNRGGALAKTSSSTPATRAGKLATTSSTKPATNPPIQAVDVRDITKKPKALPAAGQTSAPKPQVSPGKPPVVKPPRVTGLKAPGVRSGGVLSGVIDTALEKSSGSGWARSLAKGTTTALGTIAGGALGSAAGPVGTFAGGTAGGLAASKAFDTLAGANAVTRKAIATANRQGQSGGAIKGIGGKTTFDTKKNTITTGTGAQRKTAQLGKTSVVTDPKTGKQNVGYLAYKGGKAVYKRADTKNLAQTSSNPLERIGRSLFAGAYKKSDAANAAKKLAAARQSDVARNKALGVKALPGK